MPFELGRMDSRQVPSSQLGGHLPLSDTPHTAISSVDPGLKLLQLGQMAASTSDDPQVRAVITGETVDGYVAFDRLDMAKKELKTARSLFADADISKSLPGFASYGNGHGVLASAELRLGNFVVARGKY
jgi:hypothetical protein